eukprot:1979643-Rhodomonas_salina.1
MEIMALASGAVSEGRSAFPDIVKLKLAEFVRGSSVGPVRIFRLESDQPADFWGEGPQECGDMNKGSDCNLK